MDFLHSRADRLTAHIREGLLSKTWTEPLPNSRDWARQLGVSRITLYRSLAVLEKEGLLRIQKRQGIYLVPTVKRKKNNGRLKIARIVYYGGDFSDSFLTFLPWIGPLSLYLQQHQIQLTCEKCSDERLRSLCSGENLRRLQFDELLLPVSLPSWYQKLLVTSQRPTFLLGAPAQGVSLPFLNVDNISAIRHATHHLLRNRFSSLALFLDKAHGPGYEGISDAFTKACRDWPHQPIQSEVHHVSLALKDEQAIYGRFAKHLKTPHGILIVAPLSVGLLMNVLLAHRIEIPKSGEIICIASYPDIIRVYPPVAHYPVPMDAFVKSVGKIAVQFFETGELPSVNKILPMEMVPAASM